MRSITQYQSPGFFASMSCRQSVAREVIKGWLDWCLLTALVYLQLRWGSWFRLLLQKNPSRDCASVMDSNGSFEPKLPISVMSLKRCSAVEAVFSEKKPIPIRPVLRGGEGHMGWKCWSRGHLPVASEGAHEATAEQSLFVDILRCQYLN